MSAPVTSANVWTALLAAACASHDNALKADTGRLADLIGTRSARTPALPSGSKVSRPTDAMLFLQMALLQRSGDPHTHDAKIGRGGDGTSGG